MFLSTDCSLTLCRVFVDGKDKDLYMYLLFPTYLAYYATSFCLHDVCRLDLGHLVLIQDKSLSPEIDRISLSLSSLAFSH